MAIEPCNTTVDHMQKELIEHGTTAFPIACYHDDLSKGEVPWHWHEELEAAIITEGRAVIIAGNEKYTIHKGEGFFINSSILHGCWDLDGSASRFHSIVFHPRLVGGSMDSVFYLNYIKPLLENHTLESIHLKQETAWQAEVLNAIESAWQAAYHELSGYEFKVRNALSEMIFLLQCNISNTNRSFTAKKTRNSDRIKSMLRYIHEHYREELNITKIAESASISESECLRCFHSTIHITPIQYVRQYRIQRAANLLAATEERISDIAMQCGFQDMSYFTKTFREMKGCTPTEFRTK